MMEIKKYTRKPFEVEAVQVSTDNMDDVAKWCKGTVEAEGEAGDGKFIKVEVERVINERQTMAFTGDWILKFGDGFKVYTPRAFRNNFELASA